MRPTSKQRQRWLCQFQSKGVEWLRQLAFSPEERLAWKTHRRPKYWWDTDHHWRTVLERRGWVYRDRWFGPAKKKQTQNNNGRSYSGDWDDPRSRSPEHRLGEDRRNTWDVLRDYPHVWNWDYQRRSWLPISALAEQIVVDCPDYNPCENHTECERNTRKKQLLQYKFRVFADDDVQAPSKVKF